MNLRTRVTKWLNKSQQGDANFNAVLKAQLALAELQARQATYTAYKLRHALTRV